MSLNPPKTIGVVTWDFHDPKGGMGRAIQQWVHLLQHTHRVVVGTPGGETPILSFTKKRGGHLLFSFMLQFVLGSWIQQYAINPLMLPIGPGGVFLLRRSSVSTVGIVYHTYAQQARLVPGQWWKKIFMPLERRTLLQCKRIMCFCADTQRVLLDTYHIPPERIHLCAHPLTLNDVPNIERERGLCVCIARLEARKGVDILLRAWPDVLRIHPHARLMIIGTGIQQSSIDAAIKKLGPSVVRRDHISPDEMQSWLARAQIVLCSSYLEGFGLAAAEAMHAGALVIASDADGLRSLITHEQTGFLFPAGDTVALATMINRALSDKTLCASLGAAAQTSIHDHCDMRKVVDNMHEVMTVPACR